MVAPLNRNVFRKLIEFRGSLTEIILSQASCKNEEGATTIPKGSRIKRSEAVRLLTNSDFSEFKERDIVLSAERSVAVHKRTGKKLAILVENKCPAGIGYDIFGVACSVNFASAANDTGTITTAVDTAALTSALLNIQTNGVLSWD